MIDRLCLGYATLRCLVDPRSAVATVPGQPMLIRHTLLYLPAQIIGPLSQFIAILVFTHWMAPESYGVFTYIMASQDFVFLLCLSWWSQYTIRYFSGHAAHQDGRYRNSEFTILLCTVAPQVGAALLALLFISVAISPLLAGATILSTVTRCLSLHVGERARAQNRILDYTVATSAGPLIGFAVAFLIVAYVAATPAAALLGYGVAQSVALAWLTLRQDMTFAIRRPDPALLRQALSFGLPLIAAGVAAWFGMNAIRILVDHRMGAAAMGLIAVGWSLGHRITTTASMFVTIAAFPLAVASFRRGSRDEAYRQITMNGLLMLGIALPSAVGFFLIQQSIVSLLVAAPFRAMTLAVLPAALIAGLLRNVRTHVADQVFVLIERTPMVCLMTIVEAVVVVVGCVAGLLVAGPVGAAYGSAAGYGIAMVANFVVAQIGAGLRLPFVDVGLVVSAVVIMAAIVALLPRQELLPGGPVEHIVLVVVVGAAAYIGAILLLFPVVTRSAWRRWKALAAR